MRLIKMLGLAAVAAIAAMAFLGASSAAAEFATTLCEEKSATLTCPELKQAKSFTMLATTTTLLASVEVLCLHSSATGTVESPTLTPAGTPLGVQLSKLEFKECGRVSSGSHSDCKVTVKKQPLLEVLKTGVNLGTAKVNPAAPAEINIECGSFINCTYSETTKPLTVESAEHTEGNKWGMLTASKVVVAKGKGFLCPATAEWDALYEPLENKPLWLRS